jgi:uncharacterized Zn-binding protein involved in type VI secretion
MRRYFIKKGDKTTSGATVIEGDERTTHHGVALSFIGAALYFPACESTGRIIPDGPRRPCSFVGKDAALSNDLGMCKCHPTPRLIPSQDNMYESFESSELVAMGYTTSGQLPPAPLIGPFNECVRVVDSNGKPIAHTPYFIRDQSRRVYKGVTDSDGVCPRVATESRQNLFIAVSVKALENWNK